MTGIVAMAARCIYAIKFSTRHQQRDALKLLQAVSRRIGSEVLRGSSESDGCAARKWGAAPDTLPQAASGIKSIWVRMHRLGARAPIQIANVISQTEKDTLRRNGLCLDGRRNTAMRLDQSGIEPSICASRTYSDNGRNARKYKSRWMGR